MAGYRRTSTGMLRGNSGNAATTFVAWPTEKPSHRMKAHTRKKIKKPRPLEHGHVCAVSKYPSTLRRNRRMVDLTETPAQSGRAFNPTPSAFMTGAHSGIR